MFKVLIFAKRHPRLTRAEFIELYEGKHIAMTNRLVAAGALPALADYRRNYLRHDDPMNIGPAPGFDVVTEAVFASLAEYEANRAGVADPAVSKEINDDLAQLLDPSSVSYIVVDERRGGGEA